MEAKLPSGWKLIKQHRVSILVVTIILVVGIALIILGYRFDWTGFNGNNKSGKTLWDWMQLLFIPVVLAVAGFLFNHRERKSAELRAENEQKAAQLRTDAEREIEQQRAKAEQEIASDNQREAALQAYINEMSELLLHENLRKSDEDAEVRKIARVRTLTVLPRLDSNRKGSVVQFLYESGLIDKVKTIIDLSVANLSRVNIRDARLDGINLSNTNLRNANLNFAWLENADLNGADLTGAELRYADMSRASLHLADLPKADLSGAYLISADLSGANLTNTCLKEVNMIGANLKGAKVNGVCLDGADLSEADVDIIRLKDEAKSLIGTTMPEGDIHQ